MTRLLTAVDVAEYLGKPLSWVYNEWRAVGIPFRRIGNQLRCRRADLEKWIDEQAA
ncbi:MULTISPECIES: helix-turn-helix domain-containing protein [Streptomyces]|uniref:helix-turn-helix domain-containing protein n=1 Tax=Streptomyces TaxID=1883 RepID=UPI00345BA1FF